MLKHRKEEGFNWIARDRYNDLYTYKIEPSRLNVTWKSTIGYHYIDSELFTFVKWGDEKPMKISDLIRDYESQMEYKMTFNVGDKIRGVLDTRMKLAEVIELFELNGTGYKGMTIKMIEHTDKSKIGAIYRTPNLNTDFELVEEKEMNKLEELEKQVELYEKNIESQQQSLETLKRELEQLKAEKENEPWKPKDGDKYWYINTSGWGLTTVWHGDIADESRYALGNVFKTIEEANFRAEQLKVEAELKLFVRPFVEGDYNFQLTYSNLSHNVAIESCKYMQLTNMYFPSEEIAQKAIDTVGADRIKKYYFGVIN